MPARFPGAPAAHHPALAYGLALYHAGFHWEAHEVLEAVWLATARNGRDRAAVRAVIQLANAALKAALGRPRAARRLLVEVGQLLQGLSPGEGPGFADRLDAAGLSEAVAALITRIDAGEPGIAFPAIDLR